MQDLKAKLGSATSSSIDFALYRANILTPGVVDKYEALAKQASSGDFEKTRKNWPSASAAQSAHVKEIEASRQAGLKALAELKTSVDASLADVTKSVKAVDAELQAVEKERDFWLSATLSQVVEAEPELAKEIEEEIARGEWNIEEMPDEEHH